MTIVTLPEVCFRYITDVGIFKEKDFHPPPHRNLNPPPTKMIILAEFLKALKENWETLPFLTGVFSKQLSKGG